MFNGACSFFPVSENEAFETAAASSLFIWDCGIHQFLSDSSIHMNMFVFRHVLELIGIWAIAWLLLFIMGNMMLMHTICVT